MQDAQFFIYRMTKQTWDDAGLKKFFRKVVPAYAVFKNKANVCVMHKPTQRVHFDAIIQ